MEKGYFFIDSLGNLMGEIDTSSLDNANWFQRLIAKLSKRYKNSLTMLVPVKWDNPPKDFIPGQSIEIKFDNYTELPLIDKWGRKNGITENDKLDKKFIEKKLNESPDKRWIIKQP